MAAKKYLDETGLARVWAAIKRTFAGTPDDIYAAQGAVPLTGMYIDGDTHAIVSGASLSQRTIYFEIEPSTTYVIECPVVSTKRVGTYTSTAVDTVATSYATVTGKGSMQITSGANDQYLVLQLYINGETDDLSTYYKVLRVDKKSDFNAYAKRSDLVDDEEKIPLVIGTQTAKTGTWTGDAPTISELKDGQSIRYWLPEEPSGNATLNLTLADGTQTGAKNVYFRATTRLTTHLAVNNWGVFTYRENVQIGSSHYTGWWYSYGYYVDTVSRTRADNLRPVAGDSIIYGRNLVFEDGTGVFRSITNSNSTNTSHTPCNKGFKNPSEMFYYSNSSNVAVGATMANNYMYSAYNALDFRYNSNCGTSLVANRPIYLIFEHKADGLYYLKTGTWWTQDLPTTEDGYVYVYVGHAYSTNYYNFAPSHPMLWYKGGKVVPYSAVGSGGGSVDAYTKAESDARYGAVAKGSWYLMENQGQIILEVSEDDAAFACMLMFHSGTTHGMWLMSKASGGEVAITKLFGEDWLNIRWETDFSAVYLQNSAESAKYVTVAMKPIYGACPSTENWM